MPSNIKRALKEEFARFFENPSRESLRELLKNNVGEFPHCDFKKEWPIYSKLSRHVLAIGNSKGGCIIAGVAEKEDKTLEPIGLDKLKDKAEITGGVKRFIPDTLFQNIEILDFSFLASEYPTLIGKNFQVMFIQDDPEHLPFISANSANNDDGIRANAIYTRRGTSSEEANYEELQRIINRRLETGHSSQSEMDLRTHLEQLKILYLAIDKYHIHIRGGLAQMLQDQFGLINKSVLSVVGGKERTPNPNYPKETLEEFIVKMIKKKKKKIEVELGVINLYI